MLRFGFLGVLGAAMLATGCVSSSQHAELRAKYEEEAAKSRRLAEENRKLAAALKAKGVNIDDIRKRLDLIDADGGGRGIGRTLKAPEGAEDMVQLPNGGLRMGALNFRSGSAELTDKAKAALNEVANQLKAKPGFLLVVDGHTDSDPISKSNNASNWELPASVPRQSSTSWSRPAPARARTRCCAASGPSSPSVRRRPRTAASRSSRSTLRAPAGVPPRRTPVSRTSRLLRLLPPPRLPVRPPRVPRATTRA